MILSQFEEAVWHRRGSDCDMAEAWHHGGEIVSAVEAVLEFGEVAGYMLVADGAVSASDGALDVAEGGVDPLEGRVQGGLATGSSDDRLVDAAGVADPSEAVQAVTDNGAGGMEIALRQARDFGTAETLMWTAPASQGRCSVEWRSGRLRSYVRPLRAAWMAAGPDGLRGSGPKHHGGVYAPKGFPGCSDPRFDRSPSCCCPCNTRSECVECAFRPEAAGDKAHRSPSWPRASEPSCWPARLPQASSACALAD